MKPLVAPLISTPDSPTEGWSVVSFLCPNLPARDTGLSMKRVSGGIWTVDAQYETTCGTILNPFLTHFVATDVPHEPTRMDTVCCFGMLWASADFWTRLLTKCNDAQFAEELVEFPGLHRATESVAAGCSYKHWKTLVSRRSWGVFLTQSGSNIMWLVDLRLAESHVEIKPKWITVFEDGCVMMLNRLLSFRREKADIGG